MILLNPGPANTTPTVKQAMTVADICPREADFGDLLLQVRDDLVRVVQGEDTHTAVLFCGSGTAAVEAAIASAVAPTGRLLVIENGAYGTRMAAIAAAYGIAHDRLDYGVGTYPDLQRLETQLAGQRYSHVAVVHHETSTGMLNPIEHIADRSHAHGAKVIVDAMSSYAGLPLDIRSCGADLLISSSNKCIQGMAGISFVICSRELLDCLAPIPGRSYYLNMLQQHRYLEEQRQMQFTPPVQVVYALSQALKEFFAEGQTARTKRYFANFETLDHGMRALGFRRLLPEGQLSRILTAYLEPSHPNYSFSAFHDDLYRQGFTIYPGKGAAERTFRLANMGDLTPADMQAFLTAVQRTVTELGLQPLYHDRDRQGPDGH